MKTVAFFINGINSLKGGGGTERFFADFFDKYQWFNNKKFKLYYIIDKQSVLNLQEVGKLNSKKGICNFRIISNRFKYPLEIFQLYFFILFSKIDIVHIPLYNLSYIPHLKAINGLPKFLRPRLAINIVNCYIAQALDSKVDPNHISMQENYYPLFKEVNVDGYFCWNKSFEEHVKKNSMFTVIPKSIQSITSRFSDTEIFFPEKQKKNWIVFASRLDAQKNPDWVVKAILILKYKIPDILNNWKFIICGDGPLRDSLIDFSKTHLLEDNVEFRIEGKIQKILNYSKIYISCQDYDNFPSLSMAEAMSSGNVIIARNVGQTELFLKNNINGLFMDSNNEEGLANALLTLLKNDGCIETMGTKSRELIHKIHNFENFAPQIECFWNSLN